MFQGKEFMYEMRDNTIKILGTETELEFENVRQRVSSIITDQWQKTEEIRRNIGDPHPSSDQVRNALESLARAKSIRRDPSIDDGQKAGMTYRWSSNPTSDVDVDRSEVR